MLRKFLVSSALACVLVAPAQADVHCRDSRGYMKSCPQRDHLVWHPEWGAYGYWGYGACWRWDFGADRWAYVCR